MSTSEGYVTASVQTDTALKIIQNTTQNNI